MAEREQINLGEVTITKGIIMESGATLTSAEALKVTGTTASGVTVLLKDGDGNALLAKGATVPSDAGTGYAKGCLFIDTDATTVATVLFVNVGSASSCNFDAAIGAS